MHVRHVITCCMSNLSRERKCLKGKTQGLRNHTEDPESGKRIVSQTRFLLLLLEYSSQSEELKTTQDNHGENPRNAGERVQKQTVKVAAIVQKIDESRHQIGLKYFWMIAPIQVFWFEPCNNGNRYEQDQSPLRESDHWHFRKKYFSLRTAEQ